MLKNVDDLFEEYTPGQFQPGDQRNRIRFEDGERRAMQAELLRRCPDFFQYAETVKKLKMVFPRGTSDPRAFRGGQFGFDVVSWCEGLYWIARCSSFGRDSDDRHFGDGLLRRRRPGLPGSAA